MRRQRTNLRKGLRGNQEQGIVIMLVAVVMLFVVGAMAALAIDVVTLYTARSEAQMAADGAALAGARVLANSGMTSASDGTVGSNAASMAIVVATQVAANNRVGPGNLIPGGTCPGQEICVSINTAALNFVANPQVTVQVQRTDLPTFFARIWGRTAFTVKASATAEAYNPSSLQGTAAGPGLRVAPMCVKPWLLPNMSPNPGAIAAQIFDPVTGAILDTNLLGWETPPGAGGNKLRTKCALPAGSTDCLTNNTPAPWRYYPGTTDPAGSFPPPSASSVICPGCVGFNNYQLSIAGCVQTAISCNSPAIVDTTPDATRDSETAGPVNGMTHATAGGGGDSVDNSAAPSPPFQFLAGDDNPVPGAARNHVMVSDSLVTVPVINADSTSGLPASFPSVQIIGFVQLFLNPQGTASPANGHIRTQVINMVGCGTGATGQAILGNGASPVAVRLISQ